MTARMQPSIAPADLHELLDPTGLQLAIGDMVRSFDFPMAYVKQGEMLGTDLEGERANFIEGRLKGYGTIVEGCPRYEIELTRRIVSGEEQALPSDAEERLILPPLNGTRHMLGGVTACVFKIERRAAAEASSSATSNQHNPSK